MRAEPRRVIPRPVRQAVRAAGYRRQTSQPGSPACAFSRLSYGLSASVVLSAAPAELKLHLARTSRGQPLTLPRKRRSICRTAPQRPAAGLFDTPLCSLFFHQPQPRVFSAASAVRSFYFDPCDNTDDGMGMPTVGCEATNCNPAHAARAVVQVFPQDRSHR